jgi:membrane-associated phospholipid phosphatase
MINLKNYYGTKLFMVLAAILLVALLNMNPTVHNAIINVDTLVALRMNSLVGINPIFDRILAWLSTRIGDAFVLIGIYILFFFHSLCGIKLDEIIRRLSFWLWVGILCLITYEILCTPMCTVMRDTPLLALHQFKNLQTIYGFTFHSCPTNSFPSGHGLAYIFFAMMAWKKYFRISLVLWCLAIIMLSLRLIVGLHWLSDIIFGSVFLSLLVVALVDDTPLKNTYKYTQQAVSFAIKMLIAWYKRYCEVFINQHKHFHNHI